MEVIKLIKKENVGAGIALHPKINILEYEELFTLVDQIIVMTVTPGFGGQNFIESQVKKIEELNDFVSDLINIKIPLVLSESDTIGTA